MTVPDDFARFLQAEGKSVAEINPGSEERALRPEVALKAIALLAGTDVAILGGDVLSEVSGKLEYTHENWYREPLLGESAPAFVDRSRSVARHFIDRLLCRGKTNLRVILVYTE